MAKQEEGSCQSVQGPDHAGLFSPVEDSGFYPENRKDPLKNFKYTCLSVSSAAV